MVPSARFIQSICVCVGLSAALRPSAVLAQEAVVPPPRPVRVSLESKGVCSNAAKLASSVEQTIGRSVFADSEVDVRLQRRVTRASVGYKAQLQLESADGRALGSRELTADNCEELVQTEALVLSLMLDFTTEQIAEKARQEALNVPEPAPEAPTEPAPPEETTEPKGTPAEEKPPPAAKPPAEPPPEDRVSPASERRLSVDWELGVVGQAATGFSPLLELGGGLEFGLGIGAFRAAVRGSLWRQSRFTERGVPIRVKRWQLTPVTCGVWDRGALDLRYCAAFRMSAIEAEASSLDGSAVAQGFHLSLGPELGLGWRPWRNTPLRVGAFLGGLVALRPYELVLAEGNADQTLFDSSLVSFQGGLVTSWSF